MQKKRFFGFILKSSIFLHNLQFFLFKFTLKSSGFSHKLHFLRFKKMKYYDCELFASHSIVGG